MSRSKKWQFAKKGPHVVIKEYFGPVNMAWIDHTTTCKNAHGHLVYVSEPYHLLPDDLRQLSWLSLLKGWSVVVRGEAAHNPKCVRVELWLPEASDD